VISELLFSSVLLNPLKLVFLSGFTVFARFAFIVFSPVLA
jgi:hypothetical protein